MGSVPDSPMNPVEVRTKWFPGMRSEKSKNNLNNCESHNNNTQNWMGRAQIQTFLFDNDEHSTANCEKNGGRHTENVKLQRKRKVIR